MMTWPLFPFSTLSPTLLSLAYFISVILVFLLLAHLSCFHSNVTLQRGPPGPAQVYPAPTYHSFLFFINTLHHLI